MGSDRKKRALGIVQRALDLERPEREDLIRGECEGDLELERVVRRLLSREGEADHVFEPAERHRPSEPPETLDVAFGSFFDKDPSWAALGLGSGFTGPTGTPFSPDPHAPLVLSDFRVIRKLGAGGMGAVFEAVQKSLEKRVALKVLRDSGGGGGQAAERFIREARAVAQLRHPHIVGVHGIGRTPDGGYFLVMDLVRGKNLAEVMARAALSFEEAAGIAATIAEAIQHAHERGIIHRDLKPSNVLLEERRPVVTDFGLAKLLYEHGAAVSSAGAIMGTPGYMAPEQADPRRGVIGPWTDVHGLGGILYALLAGRPPYDGDSFAVVLGRIMSDDPPVSPGRLRPGMPRRLEAICMRCLEKAPPSRYQTAAEVARSLREWLEGAPGSAAAAAAAALGGGEPSPELAAPSPPPPELRVEVVPETVRAGEVFSLRAEIRNFRTALKAGRMRVEIGVDPGGEVVQVAHLGPGREWEGPGAVTSLLFRFAPLVPGPLSLQARVQAGEWSAAQEARVEVEASGALPFVGRLDAAAAIARWLGAEGCGLLVLRGEPGVGKTRLAQRSLLEEPARGGVVVLAKGRKSFRFPLQPLRDIALGLLHQGESDASRPGFADSIHALLSHHLGEDRYIAEYFESFMARDSIAREQRAMVPYFWLELILRITGGKPVLLAIDDLQWADVETVEILAEVLGLAEQRGATIKVLATVQPLAPGPVEKEVLALLEEKLRDLQADRILVERVDLQPLSASETGVVVDATFPGNSFRRDLPWLSGKLHQKTGGNPLFTEWLLKGIRSQPGLFSSESFWAPSPALTREWFEAFVPREIESMLEQRLSRLQPGVKDAAETAALLGDPFDLRLLERILGGVSALDQFLPILEEEGLVSGTELPFFYRFTHSLIHQKIHHGFVERSRWRASRLHARIAEAMQAVYPPRELAERALVYAHHLIEGNRPEEGIRLLLEGSERLLEQQLYTLAVVHLERASKLVASGVALAPADRSLLSYRLGETYRVLGRTDDALGSLEAALAVEGGATGVVAASIALARGAIHVQRGQLEAAEEIFRSVIAQEPPATPLQRAGAVSGLAASYRSRGKLKEALEEHLRALAFREEAGADIEVAISWVNAGNIYCDLGRYEEAEKAYQKSVSAFAARGLKNYLIYALSGLGNVLFRTDHRRAVENYEAAIRLCQETGNRTQLAVLHYNLAQLASEAQRYGEALRELGRALEISESVGGHAREAKFRLLKAWLHRLLGEGEAARRELDLVRKETSIPLELSEASLESARLSLIEGDLARARGELADLERHLPAEGEVVLRLGCAEVLVGLGDLAVARGLLEAAAAALGDTRKAEGPAGCERVEVACQLEHLLGLAAEGPEEALAHLEKALSLATPTYVALPGLLAAFAARVEGERARELRDRAARVLEERAAGIPDEDGRQRYLLENPLHRSLLERAPSAAAAGVAAAGVATPKPPQEA